jgi:hypothetical protein
MNCGDVLLLVVIVVSLYMVMQYPAPFPQTADRLDKFEFLDPVGLNVEKLPNPMHHYSRHEQVFGERSHGPLGCVRRPGMTWW